MSVFFPLGAYDLNETKVNSAAAGDQTSPEVIALATGGYVIVWGTPSGWSLQVYGEDRARVAGEVSFLSSMPTTWAALPDGLLAYAYADTDTATGLVFDFDQNR